MKINMNSSTLSPQIAETNAANPVKQAEKVSEKIDAAIHTEFQRDSFGLGSDTPSTSVSPKSPRSLNREIPGVLPNASTEHAKDIPPTEQKGQSKYKDPPKTREEAEQQADLMRQYLQLLQHPSYRENNEIIEVTEALQDWIESCESYDPNNPESAIQYGESASRFFDEAGDIAGGVPILGFALAPMIDLAGSIIGTGTQMIDNRINRIDNEYYDAIESERVDPHGNPIR
jgi:hypothetical protein